jgi:murein DD-endopeptidase MepM/ murein hydrolase activator NlpD
MEAGLMKKTLLPFFLALALGMVSISSFTYYTSAEEIYGPIYEDVETLIWSLKGTNGKYVTSDYGYRDLSGDGKCDDFHDGWDLDYDTTVKGDPIIAAFKGKVVVADDVNDSNAGKWIKIDHTGYTNLKLGYTKYLHLDSVSVSVGQIVNAGQIIGGIGNTGTSAVHLHFETLDSAGNRYDPANHPYKNEYGNTVSPQNISNPCSL